ncbi:MAG: stage II sporulation protein M [Rubrobacteraceae bacterium]|nr:stage II sporulation protein M [Rubrobacteraceae bacterium]
MSERDPSQSRTTPGPLESVFYPGACLAGRFLRRNAILFALCLGCYLAGALAGGVVPVIGVPGGNVVGADRFGAPGDPLGIASNNLVAVVLVALGSVTFGLLTVLLLFGNGMVAGIAVGAKLNEGWSLAEISAGVLPHGLLEIPGLLLAGVVGFKGLHWCLATIKGKSVENPFGDCLVGLALAALLIICAAPVEAYVTPVLMEAF